MTYSQIYADPVELEYVETEAGDVYAIALVSMTGDVLSVTDADSGVELSAWPIETMRTIERAREERRAAA